jgi:hypothetical protein
MTKTQHRSNIISLINEIESLHLTEAHNVSLQQSPFWNLISSILTSQLNKEYSRKSDIDVDEIIKRFDAKTGYFNLGGKSLQIREEDFQRIFGIEDGEDNIDHLKKLRRHNTEFISRRFNGMDRISKHNISDALRNAAQEDTDIGLEDVARLLTLFCLATLFVPSKNLSLPWFYVSLVEDLANMKKYNWSQHILQFLENSLSSTSRSKGEYKAVSGCIMILPVTIPCHYSMLYFCTVL